jgi:predicted small secreted protein
MRHILWLPLLAGAALAISACSTVRGAGIGAAVGAGAAAVTDQPIKDGAVLGAGAGAVVGTVAD